MYFKISKMGFLDAKSSIPESEKLYRISINSLISSYASKLYINDLWKSEVHLNPHKFMSSLSPYGDYFINGYMGKFPFIIESKNIICTSFNCSPENIGSTAINVYSLIEIMFYYKGLHQVIFLLFLCCRIIYLLVLLTHTGFGLRAQCRII